MRSINIVTQPHIHSQGCLCCSFPSCYTASNGNYLLHDVLMARFKIHTPFNHYSHYPNWRLIPPANNSSLRSIRRPLPAAPNGHRRAQPPCGQHGLIETEWIISPSLSASVHGKHTHTHTRTRTHCDEDKWQIAPGWPLFRITSPASGSEDTLYAAEQCFHMFGHVTIYADDVNIFSHGSRSLPMSRDPGGDDTERRLSAQSNNGGSWGGRRSRCCNRGVFLYWKTSKELLWRLLWMEKMFQLLSDWQMVHPIKCWEYFERACDFLFFFLTVFF